MDEAQNIKNPESKQARAARMLKSDYRIALTGTPVENHVGDLWSLMEFLNPGLLSNRAEFKRRFLVPIQASNDQKAAQRLKSLTGPFVLRRLKTDKTVIADLPEKLEMKVFCTLTQEQASLYAAVVAEAMPELESAEGIQRKGLVLATLSQAQAGVQSSGAVPGRQLGDPGPLREAGPAGRDARRGDRERRARADLLPIRRDGRASSGAIWRRCSGARCCSCTAACPSTNAIRWWRDFSRPRRQGPALFVLSLKAGGTGLNLTAASHVFHFDRWWNPAVENQATDRAFRIGQHRRVLVHKFLCAGTLEEKIDAMIEKKKALAESVVGSGEEWLGEAFDHPIARAVRVARRRGGAMKMNRAGPRIGEV